MNQPWLVRCLDARYDEDAEMIVLFCRFEKLGQKKIICFNRSDFYYRTEGVLPPHVEMYKTATLFQGKTFRIVIDDDPDRVKFADDPENSSYSKCVKMFTDRIKKEFDDVAEGLSDENRLIARRVADIVKEDHEKQGQSSADDILANEFAIRAKLNQLKTGE